MTNIFIINAGQNFAHSAGQYNDTLTNFAEAFFLSQPGFAVKTTHIGRGYNLKEEVAKFTWANVIIYQTPIWWFQVPFGFKQYLDEVFTEGHNNGIYKSDGRSSKNPAINYGTGGLLQGTKYMVNTTWNAPKEAFTLPGEFFQETNVDDGILFGFHHMNAFTGMSKVQGMHFHDVMKSPDLENYLNAYRVHLENAFVHNNVGITA